MRLYLLILLFFSSFNLFAKELNRIEAIALAERFILENGYTNAKAVELKSTLALESIELSDDKAELIKRRFNSLNRKAIGAKKDHESWSVAFDYARIKSDKLCRVVVFRLDGSDIFMAHQSGLKHFFVAKE